LLCHDPLLKNRWLSLSRPFDEEHLPPVVAPPHNVMSTPKPAASAQLAIGDVTPIAPAIQNPQASGPRERKRIQDGAIIRIRK